MAPPITGSSDLMQMIAAAIEATKVRVARDSAAVDNVINPTALPIDVAYTPNTTGRHFVGANDAHIEKYESCDTILTSEENGSVGCEWQIADVSRALH